MVGMQSGPQGACDWLKGQGEVVTVAKITIQEYGGFVLQDFRRLSQPDGYHFVGRYCFAHLHLATRSGSLPGALAL